MDTVTNDRLKAATARAAVQTPLRVLMVVDGCYPSLGGAEIQVALLGRTLKARGHDVSVLSPLLDATMPLRGTVEGIPVERIAYPRIRGLGAFILMVRFAWILLHRRSRYDAIHIHMMKNLATVAGLVRPLLRASVTVKVSGAWEFDGGVLDAERRNHWLTRLRNKWIGRCDYFQCISVYTRQRLRDAGYAEHKLRMIPNAVEVDRFSDPQSPTQDHVPTVVFVGRMRAVKGLDVLIRAWKQVCARHVARLIIAGDGPELNNLKRLAGDMGLTDSIEFPGRVMAVPALLQKADVYVQPSYQEGLPNSVLEGMSAGLPIVATRVSGNEDVVEDGVNGQLVPAGNAEALAEALTALVGDLSRARSQGRMSRQIIEEKFQTSVVVEQLIKAYQRAL
ncbi:MAG: glycosyltransferase family 4 protein [Gammaproteobacteria bacterium]|nr:glycosyltransferase family 4 protein [Gammaproteobacteria bacterium]